jgi:peroxiredoxin
MSKKWIYVAACVAAVLIAFYVYRKYHVAPKLDPERLDLVDLEGHPVKLASMKGKRMVLCFSASWCGSCRKELKDIAAIKETDLAGIEVIVISDESLEKVKMFREKTAYPFTFLKMNTAFNSIGINSIPTSYLVNTGFQVVKETVGYIDWKDPSTSQHLKKLME